jgi:hypothetical protein
LFAPRLWPVLDREEIAEAIIGFSVSIDARGRSNAPKFREDFLAAALSTRRSADGAGDARVLADPRLALPAADLHPHRASVASLTSFEFRR